MFENASRTELETLGEFGLIDHIAKNFENIQPSTFQGIGDDSTVIDAGDHFVLVSSDQLFEGIHFDLSFHPLRHLGYKAVVVGISDILAMNGVPQQIIINLGLSNRFGLEAVEELYSGIKIACEKYGVDLVGGDTSASRAGLLLNITAIGRVAKNKLTKRSGAQPNDLLVVTGDLGGAYIGLQILEREKKVFLEHPEMQPDLEKYDYIVGKQLKPEGRKDVIDLLESLDITPTSMIDVSDGIASEVFHLGKASGVGFDVYEDKLPIDQQTLDTSLMFQLNPAIVALNGGEDYELLFTINPNDYEKLRGNFDFTVIGHATELVGKHQLHTKAGNTFDIKAQGWK